MFNPSEHMMQLKGKDYLQVAWRLVWFREDHPDWAIDTRMIEADADHAVFRTIIADENGVQKSSGHGSESKKDFGDFLEKAETKSVGRALAMLGYGTQFAADELDEGERIVDSPIDRAPKKAEGPVMCDRCGKAITGVALPNGEKMTASALIGKSKTTYNGVYCYKCMCDLSKAAKQNGGGN